MTTQKTPSEELDRQIFDILNDYRQHRLTATTGVKAMLTLIDKMGSKKPEYATRRLSSDDGSMTQGGKAKDKSTPINLDKIFNDFYAYNSEKEHISMPVGRAKAKITKLINEARIDELNVLYHHAYELGRHSLLMWIYNRIKSLRKEQE